MGTCSRRAGLALLWAMCGFVVVCRLATLCSADESVEGAETYPANRIYASVFWQPEGQRRRDIVAVDPDTGACEQIVADGLEPRLSPDRRRIAYATMQMVEQGGAFEQRCSAWVREAGKESQPKEIWTGSGNCRVCWDRDGRHVIVAQAVQSTGGRSWDQQNWRVDAKLGEAEELTLPESDGVTDAAHHSDRLIAWRLGKRSTQLVTLSSNGELVADLTGPGQFDYQGRYSPDDTRIVFLRRQSGKLGVYTSSDAGKNPLLAYSEQGVTEPQRPAWSPDGRRLAAVLFDWTLNEQGRKVQRAEDDSKFRIAIMDDDGGNFRELTLDPSVREIGSLDWR
jgi:hypothetical protein